MVRGVALALYLVAVIGFANARDDDHNHDHDDDHDDNNKLGHVIVGKIELELSDSEIVEDASFVVGVQRGLAAFVGVTNSQVHVEFDHSGHDHRRLEEGHDEGHEVADYKINFPAGTKDSVMDAALDKMVKAKGNEAELLKSIGDALKAAMPESTVTVEGIELSTTPKLSEVQPKNTDGDTSQAQGLAFPSLVGMMFAAWLASTHN